MGEGSKDGLEDGEEGGVVAEGFGRWGNHRCRANHEFVERRTGREEGKNLGGP